MSKTLGEADSFKDFIRDARAIEHTNSPIATPQVKQFAKLLRVTVTTYEKWRRAAVAAGLDDFECAERAKDVGAFMLLLGHSALLDEGRDIAHFTEMGRADLNERLTKMAAWFQQSTDD